VEFLWDSRKSFRVTEKIANAQLTFSFSPQNSELLTLTYGALVTQMLRDFENVEDVNKQLERLGYNMGMRIIEDFLSKTNSSRCLDMRDTADKIQSAFR
jgi:trafficking protein particle complex subunit 3